MLAKTCPERRRRGGHPEVFEIRFRLALAIASLAGTKSWFGHHPVEITFFRQRQIFHYSVHYGCFRATDERQRRKSGEMAKQDWRVYGYGEANRVLPSRRCG